MTATTTESNGKPVPPRPASRTAAGEPGMPAPLAVRRRPAIIAAGVVMVAVGGLGAYWWATTSSDATTVLAVRTEVPRGAVITEDDLTTAAVVPDPALQTVDASQRGTIVNQRAATDLMPGALLTPQSTTSNLMPPAGLSLVGVTVTPAQMPAQPLQPADKVRVVITPDQDSGAAAPRQPASTPATVVSTTYSDDTGNTTVDVTVPTAQAAALAAAAATGNIALVVDSSER